MKKDIYKDFEIYLDAVGAEKRPLTNPFELHRFVADEIVCVIYDGKKGLSYSSEKARNVYDAFINKRPININGTKRKGFTKATKQRLFERDGDYCFYTNEYMTTEAATIEHLVPLSKGGKNNLHNLVLCTRESNQLMGDKSLLEKIKYREKNLYGNPVIVINDQKIPIVPNSFKYTHEET